MKLSVGGGRPRQISIFWLWLARPASTIPAVSWLNRRRVKLLDFYYVEACYPNALEEVIPAEFYSDADAERAIAMARDVLAVVGRLIAGR